jgi:hypothetical protein
MQLKRIVGAALSTLMAGVSLMAPVLAADLADYPAPFVPNGTADFVIVVGSTADPADIVGAINVAARLGGEPGEVVTLSGTGAGISGGKSEDIALGSELNASTGLGETFTDSKISGLLDARITHGDEDYDIHEELVLGTGLRITVTGESGVDDEFGSDVVLTTADEGLFKYCYVFEDDIEWEYLDGTTTNSLADKKLEITFLGQDLEITGFDADSITLQLGSKVSLGEGDTVVVGTDTVEVGSIYSETVEISVGSYTEFVDEDTETEIGDSGVFVEIETIAYSSDDPALSKIIARVGTDVGETYNDGDSMELFGEPSKINDAEWVWEIDMNNTAASDYLCAVHNQDRTDVDDGPPGVGEYIELPNDYGKVGIVELTVDTYGEYRVIYDDNVDYEAGDLSDNNEVIMFESRDTAENEGFKIGSEEAEVVYINGTGFIGYLNEDSEVEGVSGSTFSIAFEDYTAAVTWLTGADGRIDNVTITEEESGNAIRIDVSDSGSIIDGLGGTEKDADGTDVLYDGVQLGTREYDIRTIDGIKIDDPSSNGDSDRVIFFFPGDEVLATTALIGPEGAVTGGVAGQSVERVVPIKASVAKLDTDVADAAAEPNLILVGGPCVNKLTAEALGLTFPTCGVEAADALDISSGEAAIKLVEDVFKTGKVALVVAGYDAADTVRACGKLQNYEAADLTGMNLVV